MRSKSVSTPEPAEVAEVTDHEPVVDHDPVTAEPAPDRSWMAGLPHKPTLNTILVEPMSGVLAEFMAWQPNPKLVELHAHLGRSLAQMRNQIGEHLNEAANGIQRLIIDLETIDRRDPGVAFLQHLIATLKGH
jgi:hypothetical protein